MQSFRARKELWGKVNEGLRRKISEVHIVPNAAHDDFDYTVFLLNGKSLVFPSYEWLSDRCVALVALTAA